MIDLLNLNLYSTTIEGDVESLDLHLNKLEKQSDVMIKPNKYVCDNIKHLHKINLDDLSLTDCIGFCQNKKSILETLIKRRDTKDSKAIKITLLGTKRFSSHIIEKIASYLQIKLPIEKTIVKSIQENTNMPNFKLPLDLFKNCEFNHDIVILDLLSKNDLIRFKAMFIEDSTFDVIKEYDEKYIAKMWQIDFEEKIKKIKNLEYEDRKSLSDINH